MGISSFTQGGKVGKARGPRNFSAAQPRGTSGGGARGPIAKLAPRSKANAPQPRRVATR